MAKNSKRKAFTLIELLTVISVIAILAAILTPLVSNSVGEARKLRASRNLQQIAAAYASFSMKRPISELNLCQKASEWAGVLSKYGELDVASMFYLPDDYLIESAGGTVPKTVGIRKNGQWRINPDFERFPLSIVLICGVSTRAPAATTPIAYTRGLDSADGTWREAIGDSGGIYGEAGGFIAFLDGHVEFFPNITDGQTMLTHYYSGEKTSKISETVNRGARAISWKGIEWEAN